MFLLGGLLQTWLLVGICGSIAADDFLSDPDTEYSQFLPAGTDGGGANLALGLEPTSITSNNLDSDLFAQADPAGLLPSNGENSASDFLSTIDPSNEAFTDDASNLGLIAGSDVSCGSSQGPPITRIRRDNVCNDPSLLEKLPTAVEQPMEGSDITFPPPGSNPGRLSGSRNDPKPRPKYDNNVANTEEDFKICPSGLDGYREFAVCDSGLDKDRRDGIGLSYSLWDCTPRK